jgi:hypothetical protein
VGKKAPPREIGFQRLTLYNLTTHNNKAVAVFVIKDHIGGACHGAPFRLVSLADWSGEVLEPPFDHFI